MVDPFVAVVGVAAAFAEHAASVEYQWVAADGAAVAAVAVATTVAAVVAIVDVVLVEIRMITVGSDGPQVIEDGMTEMRG